MWVFLMVSVFIYNAAAFLVRKRLSAAEIYTTIMFALFMNLLVDTFASFHYELWGFFEKSGAEFAALWIILGIYPAATVLIINWYPYSASWRKKLLYLWGWASFSTFYEYLTMELGIMWHDNGWNLFWSFIIYPPLYYMLIFQIRLYRWLVKSI